MNVFSAFDGMGCGFEALNRIEAPVSSYFASEIDRYAMKVARKNHVEIMHVGDITTVPGKILKGSLDLLLGGSPCQGFSFAGKQLNFDDPRSALFFEFVRILEEAEPKYFLFENVKMKKESRDIISKYLGVEPIEINSSLVSAQNRKRLYWTNIPGVTQPKDKGVLLKDIVFSDSIFQHAHGGTKGGVLKADKSPCVTTSFHRNAYPVCLHNLYRGFKESKNRVFTEKSPTIRAASGGGATPSLLLSEKALQYMDRVSSGGRSHWDFGHHSEVINEKSSAVVANFFKGVPYNVLKDWNCIRKFDPIECERLQTLPDNYTLCDGVSNTQRYKMISNGWTVDVIAHILSFIPELRRN